jgi:hypothetical protein
MVSRRTTLPLVLAACLAVALPAGAAQAQSSGAPVAHSAGGDAPALTPSVVAVPLARADKAINNAADAVDAGNGAQAVGPLRATRRYMIRAYRGAKFLIAQTPPPAPAEEGSAAGAARFVRVARRAVRASHRGRTATGSWIRAHAGQFAPPAFADTPTAVFSVFQGQYDVATAAVGMLPDVQGGLLARVKTSLYTAIVLRNRLVKIVAAAEPPAPAEEGSASHPGAQAAQEEGVTLFADVMPAVTVLLDDEMQQMKSTQQDTTVPAASSAVLANALAADQQIEAQVNLLWPPVVVD